MVGAKFIAESLALLIFVFPGVAPSANTFTFSTNQRPNIITTRPLFFHALTCLGGYRTCRPNSNTAVKSPRGFPRKKYKRFYQRIKEISEKLPLRALLSIMTSLATANMAILNCDIPNRPWHEAFMREAIEMVCLAFSHCLCLYRGGRFL